MSETDTPLTDVWSAPHAKATGLYFRFGGKVDDVPAACLRSLAEAGLAHAWGQFLLADHGDVLDAGGDVREVAVRFPDGTERVFTFSEFQEWVGLPTVSERFALPEKERKK